MNSYFSEHLLSRTDAEAEMNRLAENGQPFLFVISFTGTQSFVMAPDKINKNYLRFSVPGGEDTFPSEKKSKLILRKLPLPFTEYTKIFNGAMYHLRMGDTYLLNLTCSTPVECDGGLYDIYSAAGAPFKLWVKDTFVLFSPERFIRTENGFISTHPMKGTIDASVPDAARNVLSNKKEMAEHATITDLLRNDINLVATGTEVKRYRYIETVTTTEGSLLQVSSHIQGKILPELLQKPGTLLFSLLPAGSVTGAPKKRTVEILNAIELHKRGFYTGVFGYYNGKDIDSAVMIRFIEQTPAGLVYKSGGGITTQSIPEEEYDEMIKKVYVPVS